MAGGVDFACRLKGETPTSSLQAIPLQKSWKCMDIGTFL